MLKIIFARVETIKRAIALVGAEQNKACHPATHDCQNPRQEDSVTRVRTLHSKKEMITIFMLRVARFLQKKAIHKPVSCLVKIASLCFTKNIKVLRRNRDTLEPQGRFAPRVGARGGLPPCVGML
ncbi:MAG: hypothetical protein KIT08_05350 [Anaerolineales bacterium]|nr:MAG: hypothetical protein KIT08_05350 [Anaerolineales bacterium]